MSRDAMVGLAAASGSQTRRGELDLFEPAFIQALDVQVSRCPSLPVSFLPSEPSAEDVACFRWALGPAENWESVPAVRHALFSRLFGRGGMCYSVGTVRSLPPRGTTGGWSQGRDGGARGAGNPPGDHSEELKKEMPRICPLGLGP